MAININVQVARSVPKVNDEGLTLVIFRHAREVQGESLGYSSEPVRLNSLQDLYDSFSYDSGSGHSFASQKELYEAEYLLRAGVNLLGYAVETEGTIGTEDLYRFADPELYQYKMILVPGLYLSWGGVDTSINRIMNVAKLSDVQLFLNLKHDIVEGAEANAAIHAYTTYLSAKLEVAFNFGLPNFTSYYPDIPDDFVTSGDEFYGISTASAIVVRKSYLLNSGLPWLPVAGESYGRIDEFVKLYNKIGKDAKEELQMLNVNVLLTKIGVGNRFVSQNTQYQISETETTKNPLLRSHVVTEVLWLKREFSKIAARFESTPNISKTWNAFEVALGSLLDSVKDKDGIERYSVSCGLGKTMEESDIEDGILKAEARFLPVRVVEDITIDMVVQESSDTYDITINGGAL
jgi:hypothetical protein